MKLTKVDARILRVIDHRARDVFDVADAVRRDVRLVFDDCASLKDRGLVDWMYPEDALSITPAGRAALEKP